MKKDHDLEEHPMRAALHEKEHAQFLKQIPPELDGIADKVLAYRPKAKAKASKQRQKRKAKRDAKKG